MAARIMVHGLDHAVAALTAAAEAGCPVSLVSAPMAAASLGVAGFAALVAAAAARVPAARFTAVVDCGDKPGLALAALRQGLPVVAIRAPDEVLRALADIAAQTGARLDAEAAAPTLDLCDAPDAGAACKGWLAG